MNDAKRGCEAVLTVWGVHGSTGWVRLVFVPLVSVWVQVTTACTSTTAPKRVRCRRLCDGGRRKGSQTAQGGGTTLVSSTKNDGVLQQQPWRMVVAVPQQHSSKESAPNNLRCVWVCLYTSWMVVIVYMYVVASAKRGHITCFRILAYSTYKGIS